MTGAGGVLPAQCIVAAISDGAIGAAAPIEDGQVQPASLDLRLGAVAHRLRCSFVPGDDTVAARLADYSMEEIDLAGGAILERDRPYLIPLVEELALPPTMRARTNPKSSTGRVDVFCRVITDHSHRFDEIAPGYAGRLWLEVVPRSFTIKVRQGLRLNQLRLATGREVLGDGALRDLHAAEPVLWRGNGDPPAPKDLVLADGLFLGVDLSGSGSQGVGYKAKRNSKLLDLTRVRGHRAEDFWEPVAAEVGARLVLEPEEFYLLISSERVRIPPAHAAEMTAYDPTAGELRTHYAGFFDPGFGHRPGSEVAQGTRAVLEVRARDVPFMLEHGQSVCKLVYEPMLDEPDILYGAGLSSNYQDQDLTLSKHFQPAGTQVGDPAKPTKAVG